MPRFGRNRVIQVLVGSRGKEILDAGLHELTTYGLLKQKSSNYLHELFREMEEAGTHFFHWRSIPDDRSDGIRRGGDAEPRLISFGLA